MHSNARKQARNRSIKSRLRTLERGYLSTVETGNGEGATTALCEVVSALDKAAKNGVIHKSKAVSFCGVNPLAVVRHRDQIGICGEVVVPQVVMQRLVMPHAAAG